MKNKLLISLFLFSCLQGSSQNVPGILDIFLQPPDSIFTHTDVEADHASEGPLLPKLDMGQMKREKEYYVLKNGKFEMQSEK
jgi:hypothetical protein